MTIVDSSVLHLGSFIKPRQQESLSPNDKFNPRPGAVNTIMAEPLFLFILSALRNHVWLLSRVLIISKGFQQKNTFKPVILPPLPNISLELDNIQVRSSSESEASQDLDFG